MKALSISMASVAAIAVLAILPLYRGIIRFNDPGLKEFFIQGVDVSHHQGVNDWLRLKSKKARYPEITSDVLASFG